MTKEQKQHHYVSILNTVLSAAILSYVVSVEHRLTVLETKEAIKQESKQEKNLTQQAQYDVINSSNIEPSISTPIP